MHIDYDTGLHRYNLPQLWLTETQADPRLQRRVTERRDPVPLVTDVALGSWFCDAIAGDLLAACREGCRCIGVAIAPVIAERMAAYLINRHRLQSGRPFAAPAVAWAEGIRERHFGAAQALHARLPRIVGLLADRSAPNGVDLGDVLFNHLCEDLWAQVLTGGRRFQCYLDDLVVAPIADYASFIARCDAA